VIDSVEAEEARDQAAMYFIPADDAPQLDEDE
jgi:hypothetical protein